MSLSDLLSLLPFILLGATAVAAMLGIAARRSHGLTVGVVVTGLSATFASLWAAATVTPRVVTPLLVVDRFTLVYVGLLVAGAVAVTLLAWGYLQNRDEHAEEFYVLLVTATLGSAVLAASHHFASLFLGLETLSVSLYGLIAYRRSSPRSTEAGIKYLILAAASSAFLLFGMALVFADVGTMDLAKLAFVARTEVTALPWLDAGMVLMLVGIGFKLAAVPFHLWTPDVYEGAPAPVTAFVASVSKAGVLALLLRFFLGLNGSTLRPVVVVLAVMAIASILVGNLLALLQRNVKRILAYSSIAHMGYILVPFAATGALVAEAVTYSLLTYFVATIGTFGVVAVLSGDGEDRDDLEDYRGLMWQRPWLGAFFALMLFSLAGIPLTAGFLGKYYVVVAGVGADAWAPVLVLVAGSVVGIYYYLRIIVTMASPAEGEALPLPSYTVVGGVTLVAVALLVLWLGLLPTPFIELIRPAVAGLV